MELVFRAGDLEAERNGHKEEVKNCGGGVRHHDEDWQFPEDLPCRWRIADELHSLSSDQILIQAPLRRNSLASLGLMAAEWFGRLDYLKTKASVDAASRSAEVIKALAAEIKHSAPISVLDLGAGALSMLPVVRSLGADIRQYIAMDTDAEALGEAPVESWIEPRVADAFAYTFSAKEKFDLVVANAFADLASPQQLATLLKSVVKIEGGLVYLPITFIGHTALEPPLSSTEDGLLLDDINAFKAYHDHLREIEGQFLDIEALKSTLQSNGFDLVAEAPSDWLLPLGSPFASFIVDFVSNALTPRFLRLKSSPLLRDRGLSWIKRLRAEAAVLPSADQATASPPRHLRARNVDLLFTRRGSY